MAKILIIDDDAAIRYTVGEICKFAGWEAIEAENGARGLELFTRHHPDLVLVDYHMPALDGLETVTRLRELDPYTPIIVLTVDERQEICDAFLAAGASDFALKPIKAPDLIARLRVHLQYGQLRREQAVELPKGMSASTLEVIAAFLRRQTEPLTIEEIQTGVELAYPTVHRYLMYLVQQGRVVICCDYGRVGRPRNKYIWQRD
ncbi:two-component system response regulator [Carboxydocella sp. JDF658]|uniref:response regulator n=1 Tax=Carboxydocella sp. JDF658 TaxID=1926600 RepID=UPI0009AD2BBF|nr:response regulator [Carboxydocella sp. JDF658]GAW31877.1 transcriptional regulator [Carboxydocella sp. JDF658]